MLSAECHKGRFHVDRKLREAVGLREKRFNLSDGHKSCSTQKLPCYTRRLLARLINQMLASGARISADKLLKSERGDANISRARQIAIYLMHTSLSFTYGEVSRIYGRDRTTIAHSCKVVEDLRDDPVFDGWIEQLEEAVDMMVTLTRPISSRKDAANV